MRSVIKIALMAIFAIATTIAISCSDDVKADSNLYDTRDGNTYNTVIIGKQEWMAENLRYNAAGSKCYNNETSYCTYNWATAIYVCPIGWHLPSDEEWKALVAAVGGLSISATQLKANFGNTNDFGFSALSDRYAYSWWSFTDNYSSLASGWMVEYNSDYINRSDEEKSKQFSVRCVKDKGTKISSSSEPSSSSSRPSSSSIPSSSSVPSSSSIPSSSSSAGLLQNGTYHNTGTFPSGSGGNLSIINNNPIGTGSNTFTVNSNGPLTKFYVQFGEGPGYYEMNVLPYLVSSTGGIYRYNIPMNFSDLSGYSYIRFGSDNSPAVIFYLGEEDRYGTDIIYGIEYKTVRIGTTIWMRENLKYEVEDSKCYGDETGTDIYGKCPVYGRLYDWAKANYVCQDPWRLPTNADWDNLYRYADRTSGTSSPYYSLYAGWYLKSENGWNSAGDGLNGIDALGFTALPYGYAIGYPGGAIFQDDGICGYWWSASASVSESSRAYYRNMCKYNDKADFGTYDKSRLLSVRCVR